MSPPFALLSSFFLMFVFFVPTFMRDDSVATSLEAPPLLVLHFTLTFVSYFIKLFIYFAADSTFLKTWVSKLRCLFDNMGGSMLSERLLLSFLFCVRRCWDPSLSLIFVFFLSLAHLGYHRCHFSFAPFVRLYGTL